MPRLVPLALTLVLAASAAGAQDRIPALQPADDAQSWRWWWEFNRETFPAQWELWQRVETAEFEVVQRFPRQNGMVGPSLTLYGRVDRTEPGERP